MSDARNSNSQTREATLTYESSVRPVIEHALTVYFDGNAELARTLIDRLLNENQQR